jgi:hypothetical protein
MSSKKWVIEKLINMWHSWAEAWVVPFDREPGPPLDLDEGKPNNGPWTGPNASTALVKMDCSEHGRTFPPPRVSRWRLSKLPTMLSESSIRGVRDFKALFIASSLPRAWSRFPKRMVALGAYAMPTLFPAIWSLEDFIVEHASPLHGSPTVGVSNLAPTSKFIGPHRQSSRSFGVHPCGCISEWARLCLKMSLCLEANPSL